MSLMVFPQLDTFPWKSDRGFGTVSLSGPFSAASQQSHVISGGLMLPVEDMGRSLPFRSNPVVGMGQELGATEEGPQDPQEVE